VIAQHSGVSERTLRASYTAETIRVYQAFPPDVAYAALDAGKFVPPFKMARMTWIKPSFNWMMYRSGYASKPGQEVILAIDMTRQGFEWALENAALTRFVPDVHAGYESWKRELEERPVRIQWDPERDWRLQPIALSKTIQIGLKGEAVQRYVDEWIVRIENVTAVAKALREAATVVGLPSLFPLPSAFEVPYPLTTAISTRVFCDLSMGD
jgi:Domain of unknown function (DUF4291)